MVSLYHLDLHAKIYANLKSFNMLLRLIKINVFYAFIVHH